MTTALTRDLTDQVSQVMEEGRSLLDTVIEQPQTQANAAAYVKALLGPVERKNSWQLAEHAGYRDPYTFQYLLGRAVWDADALRDALQRYVGRQLGWRGGILALIDRALYLPASWPQDRARCAAAGIPETVPFATKPTLGKPMLAHAFAAGFAPAWVVGDEVYGRDGTLRRFLERRQQACVLAVAANPHVRPDLFPQRRPDAVPATLGPEDWPEVRRLLGDVVWRVLPDVAFRWAWSQWRRWHQALARVCHRRARQRRSTVLQL